LAEVVEAEEVIRCPNHLGGSGGGGGTAYDGHGLEVLELQDKETMVVQVEVQDKDLALAAEVQEA
jgi:hypothetical protein